MNALKQEDGFKTWIKSNIWTIVLGVLMAWFGYQQELVKGQQEEIHVMMKDMISEIKVRCNNFENELKTMQANQVYDRNDLDWIIRELDLRKQIEENRKTMRSRGIVINEK